MAVSALSLLAIAAAGCAGSQSAIPADAGHGTVSALANGGAAGGGGGTGGGGKGFGATTIRGRVVGDPGTFAHINGTLTYSVTVTGLSQVFGSINQLPAGTLAAGDLIEAVNRTTNQLVNTSEVITNVNALCSPAPCAAFPAEGAGPNVNFGGIGPMVVAGDTIDLMQVDPAYIASIGGILNYRFFWGPVGGGPNPFTRHVGIAQF